MIGFGLHEGHTNTGQLRCTGKHLSNITDNNWTCTLFRVFGPALENGQHICPEICSVLNVNSNLFYLHFSERPFCLCSPQNSVNP